MPRTILTQKLVASKRTQPGDYWDSAQPGLGLRVLPSGRKSWVVLFRGSRRAIGSYPTWSLKEARARAREKMQAIESGMDPFAAAGGLRFGELVEMFLADYARPRYVPAWSKEVRRLVERPLDRWRHSPADQIARAELVAFLDGLAREAGTVANRTHSVLSKMFSWWRHRGYVPENPLRGVPKPARERQRTRVLSEKELRAVLMACRGSRSPFARVLELRALTWQRANSILRMAWREIEGDCWTISETKAGRPHRVYLSEASRGVLARCDQHTEWAFPAGRGAQGPIRQMSSHAVRRIRTASKVDGWQPRDLRRTATTLATSRGASPFIVDKILDHTDRRGVTAIYDRTSYYQESRAVLKDWGEWIQRLLA